MDVNLQKQKTILNRNLSSCECSQNTKNKLYIYMYMYEDESSKIKNFTIITGIRMPRMT